MGNYILSYLLDKNHIIVQNIPIVLCYVINTSHQCRFFFQMNDFLFCCWYYLIRKNNWNQSLTTILLWILGVMVTVTLWNRWWRWQLTDIRFLWLKLTDWLDKAIVWRFFGISTPTTLNKSMSTADTNQSYIIGNTLGHSFCWNFSLSVHDHTICWSP